MLFVVLAILFAGLPLVLASLEPRVSALLGLPSLPLSFSIQSVWVVGVILAGLAAARYVLKPTRLFGPVAIATDVAEIAYLLVLLLNPVIGIGLSNVTIAIGFGAVLTVFLLVPVISLASHVVTTVGDVRRPTERLAWQYPP